LLAESTGKVGKGIIPVDREELAAPEVYGNDRVFAYVHTEHATDVRDRGESGGARKGRACCAANRDVRTSTNSARNSFCWEIATAVAGSIIGINAFNQPDVEASKIATRNLTSAYEKTVPCPQKHLCGRWRHQAFHRREECCGAGEGRGWRQVSGRIFEGSSGRIGAGDYFAVLGFIQMNAEHEKKLQAIRHAVRDKKHVATCLGFGPRFLHSTGQAYKGGPNSGVFLQITCDDAVGTAGAGTEIHVRSSEGGAGAGRFSGAGGARAAGAAGASARCGCRSGDAGSAVQKALG
jgi:transaldolase / glucose-6-phosphate isomerase